MNQQKHKKPRSSPAATPIFWHKGWQVVSPPASEHNPEAGGLSIEAGGHPAGLCGQEQPQLGVEHRVRMSTEPPVLTGDGNREPQYLRVRLEQQANDTDARVLIGHNDARAMAATVDEARRFALDILELVDGEPDPEI